MGANDLLQRFQLQQMQKAMQSREGKKIRLRWNTPTECRRSLAKVNNMVVNGELDAKSANSIYFSANLILEALKMEHEQKKTTNK